MCLDKIVETFKSDKTVGIGYSLVRKKAHEIYTPTRDSNLTSESKKGVEYKAGTAMLQAETLPRKKYRAGFHIFKYRKDAKSVCSWVKTGDANFCVVKVSYRSVLLIGKQAFGDNGWSTARDIIVTGYRTILNET